MPAWPSGKKQVDTTMNKVPSLFLDTATVVRAPKLDIHSRSRRGYFYLTISRFSGMFVGLLSSAIMGRLLGPSDYGLVAMAMSVMILLNLLKDFGLTTALIQTDTLGGEQLDAVFWINLLVASCCAGIGILAATPVAQFYGDPRIRDLIIALSFGVIVTSLVAPHSALLRRNLNFAPLMSADMAGQLTSLVVGVALAWWSGSYWAIVASTLAAAFATAFVTFICLPWLPGPTRALSSAKRLIAFGANLSLFSLLNFFSNQLGMIVVGSQVGAVAAGHFNRAQQLLNLSGSTLMQPIAQVVLPTLSRLQNDEPAYRATYLAILRRTSFVFALIGTAVVLEGDRMAVILLGPQWGEAGLMFRWFGLAIVAVGMASHTGNVLMSQNRAHELRNWGLGDACIRAGASLIGLSWGAVGVAAAYSVATLAITVPIVAAIVGRRGPVGFFDQMRAIRPAALLCAGGIAVGLAIRGHFSLWAPSVSVPVSALTVIAMAMLIMLLDPVGRLVWADFKILLMRNRRIERIVDGER